MPEFCHHIPPQPPDAPHKTGMSAKPSATDLINALLVEVVKVVVRVVVGGGDASHRGGGGTRRVTELVPGSKSEGQIEVHQCESLLTTILDPWIVAVALTPSSPHTHPGMYLLDLLCHRGVHQAEQQRQGAVDPAHICLYRSHVTASNGQDDCCPWTAQGHYGQPPRSATGNGHPSLAVM